MTMMTFIVPDSVKVPVAGVFPTFDDLFKVADKLAAAGVKVNGAGFSGSGVAYVNVAPEDAETAKALVGAM